MATKTEKKAAEKKSTEEKKSTAEEKKLKAWKKMPTDAEEDADEGRQEKKRTKKSVEDGQDLHLQGAEAGPPGHRISSKAMGIMNSLLVLEFGLGEISSNTPPATPSCRTPAKESVDLMEANEPMATKRLQFVLTLVNSRCCDDDDDDEI
ncbi:histone B2 [Actinidia rufa]|uniref:Histone B2 n=1 Tax=Actinidia rufa TaxID=165716 RepID=A0A7J0FHG5_9ERIC|nr:histone B2 [Actinidia rufa]